MRRLRTILLVGVLAGLLVGANSTQALAQDKKKAGDRVQIETIDGITLEGTWYSGNQNSPVVLMLHAIKSNRNSKAWQALAETLHKNKFAVLSIDFRGHGDSKVIKNQMAFERYNTRLRTMFRKNKLPKNNLSFADYQARYLPYLANDIAAAKAWLDNKSDAAFCNSASLILVGEKTGANLGAQWLLSEWNRYPGKPQFPTLPQGPQIPDLSHPMGQYVIGCVWLSMRTTPIPKKAPSSTTFKQTVSYLQKAAATHKTPMLFLYNEDVENDRKVGQSMVRNLFSLKGNQTKREEALKKILEKYYTAGQPVKGAKELQGAELLLKSGLNNKITGYLKAVAEKKKNGPKTWALNQKQYFWVYSRVRWAQANDLNQAMFNFNSFLGFPTR